MNKFIFCLIGMLLYFHASSQQRDSVRWLSFEQLSEVLAIRPKKVLLFFHTDWCTYCRKMKNEVFTEKDIVRKLNQDYYAVHFDAESTETVYFDTLILRNEGTEKRRGQYHDLAKLLAAQQDRGLVFPTTLLLDADFNVRKRLFQYISRKKLLELL